MGKHIRKFRDKFSQFLASLLQFDKYNYEGINDLRDKFDEMVKQEVVIKSKLPHDITLLGKKISKSDSPTRVKYVYRVDRAYDFKGVIVPVITKNPTEITNIPPEEKGVIWVVSRDTKEAMRYLGIIRDDIFAIGNTLRDSEHRIVEARALIGLN